MVPAKRWLPKVGVGFTLIAFSNERQGVPGLSEVAGDVSEFVKLSEVGLSG